MLHVTGGLFHSGASVIGNGEKCRGGGVGDRLADTTFRRVRRDYKGTLRGKNNKS